MITIAQYFGAKAHSVEQLELAADLLERVDLLTEKAIAAGAFERDIDPDTGSEISGARGGAGDGGFRLPGSTTGTPNSSHKEAKAVDPFGKLDEWLDGFEHGVGDNSMLHDCGLYREAPGSTPGWCHLSTRAPHSGRRTFNP
jgi:hypothetical protein